MSVTIAIAQFSSRISIRDIVGNVSEQAHRLYYIILAAQTTRANLARMNERKPDSLCEALFKKRDLMTLLRGVAIHPLIVTKMLISQRCIDRKLIGQQCSYIEKVRVIIVS
ncbi:MAG: hypothetical protein H6936_16190 [Burkholderiales bacterium]|nr:hypothetical protein [Nitrosomonas sp.]MCP5276352.1 hypothetical protein [Burkholderiales bacterium]